jgi:integrase
MRLRHRPQRRKACDQVPIHGEQPLEASRNAVAERLWAVPAERDKAGQGYRIPLTDPVLTILRQRRELATDDGYIFPTRSRRTLRQLLRSLGYTNITIHGFRSSFADWATESTGFATEIREATLGHRLGSEVARSYTRTDLLDRRRRLLEAWAAYISAPSPRTGAEIVTIGAGR